MLVGQEYDPVQFVRDVKAIIQKLGERKPWGFFTIQSYQDDVVALDWFMGEYITMVDVQKRRHGKGPDEVGYAKVGYATPAMRDHILRLAASLDPITG